MKLLVPHANYWQQHARQSPPIAPYAMQPSLAPQRHQPRSMQRLLHPGVTQHDAMLSFQLLVKMLYVHVEILLPVEREYFLRSEEHTSELQSHLNLVCRLLLEKKKKQM